MPPSHPHGHNSAHAHDGAVPFPGGMPLDEHEPAPGHHSDSADVGAWESPWIDIGGEG